MTSIFTKIIKGDIPSHKLIENDLFYSFLDINPIAPGHSLVIPKIEIDEFFDLDNHLLSEILVFAKPLSSALKKTIPCNRVGLIVAGLEVPHAHLHLVPIQSTSQLSFEHAKPAIAEELAILREKIISNI